MKATAYLLKRTIINGIKSLGQKKGALITYILIAVMCLFAVLIPRGSDEPVGEVRNLDAYFAIVIGVYLLMFFMSIFTGLKQGTNIFRMSDVNLLFTAPIQPARVLMYGMLRQAGTLVLASLFLIVQYGNLRMNCGLGGGALAGLMIGYIFLGVFSQLAAANLYAYCASHANGRKTVNSILRVLGIALALLIVWFTTWGNEGTDIFGALVKLGGASWWNYVPFIGWARAITAYAATNEWMYSGIYIALSLVGTGVIVLLMQKRNSDFYEDVLLAAENMQNMKSAAESGKMVSSGTVSKRAKRELPELRGKGASVFFYRAMREQTRKSSWFFSISTFAAVIAPCFGLLIFSDAEATTIGLWPVLYFAAYLMVFVSMTNNVSRELTQHYLFVAPQSSFKKLLAICAPQMVKHLADTAVFAALCAFIINMPVGDVIGATLVYFSLGAVFAAGMLFVEKLLGSLKTKVVIILLYFVVLLVLVAPGMVLGTILYGVMGVAAYAIAAVWNVLMSFVLVAICRNLLNEMAK